LKGFNNWRLGVLVLRTPRAIAVIRPNSGVSKSINKLVSR
jgi:hypothetical protein